MAPIRVAALVSAILLAPPAVRAQAPAIDPGQRQAIEQIPQVRPDVVLMDMRMPAMSGLEALQAMGRAGTLPPTIILTTFDDDEYVFGALQAVASGFLLKDAGPDVLVAAVRTVAAGDALVA